MDDNITSAWSWSYKLAKEKTVGHEYEDKEGINSARIIPAQE